MDKVLPAKRVAIEKFTDRPDRPGFTDTNDPYTSCLREIDRRMKGTAFDNPVDDDDLKCRAIALVAAKHDEIIAAKDSAEREAMQHAIPQKVFESFLRNKFPELRFLKNLPDKVRLPGGEIFPLNQSPEDPVRNSMIVGPDEEMGQDGFINAAIPTEPRGGQLVPGLDADNQNGSEGDPLERPILPNRRPDMSGTSESEQQMDEAPVTEDQSKPPRGNITDAQNANDPQDSAHDSEEPGASEIPDFFDLELAPPVLRMIIEAEQNSEFEELTFLSVTNFPKMTPDQIRAISTALGGAALASPAAFTREGTKRLIRAAFARIGAGSVSGPVGWVALAVSTSLGTAGIIADFMAELRQDDIRNLEHAYEIWRAKDERKLPNNFVIDGPFQDFLDGMSRAAQEDFFNALIAGEFIDRDARLDPGQKIRTGDAFSDLNSIMFNYVEAFEETVAIAQGQAMFPNPATVAQLGAFQGIRAQFRNFRDSIVNSPLLEDQFADNLDFRLAQLDDTIRILADTLRRNGQLP